MQVFTLGFTKKSAETFFELLRTSGVQRVIDVRLNNVSQLAGFTKRDDLKYFLKAIAGIDYIHCPDLSPTPDMLEAFRAKGTDWAEHEKRFLGLLEKRKVETLIPRELIADGCLLCSEEKPHHCHRRLVAQYLSDHWGGLTVTHLV